MSPRAPAKKTRKAPPPSVRIRMYNTGFGDCFLVKFPCAGGERKVLIDCGKHRLSQCKPGIGEIVQQVLKDLGEGEKDGPRVDVLVVSHRHQDHVSGFAVAGWEDVSVGEVWMPWTEDPDDPAARNICDVQSRRALRLQEMIPRLGLAQARSDYLLEYAGNNMTNEDAMKRLHGGFKGHPRRLFLPAPDSPPRPGEPARAPRADDRLISTQHLPGVKVYVLGPSRDPEVIRDMKPPAGESYEMALRDGADAPWGSQRSPFSSRWQLDAKSYSEWFTNKRLEDPLNGFISKHKKKTTTWEDWAKYVGHVADEPEMELAASLESSVNGTSLVLLFKIGCATLLFPGDAQWGTWNAMLADDRWQRLLKGLSFYKVGHHGSENATPRRFVEEYLPQSAWAMIPTDNVTTWPMIPDEALLTSLANRGVKFVRSDGAPTADPKGFDRFAPQGDTLYVDLEIPI